MENKRPGENRNEIKHKQENSFTKLTISRGVVEAFVRYVFD